MGKVSRKIWILIAAAIVLLAVGLTIYLHSRPYATLITGATSQEAATVMTWLDSQGFRDYRLEGTGTILVPEGQVYNLKARLLQEQYSGSTTPFSGYFERVSALSTQTDRNNAWLVARTEDIRQTIRAFPGVLDASVSITPGTDRRYVLDQSNMSKATAAVTLTMQDGQLLSEGQANAIRNYVSHSVEDLSPEDVSIDDTWGNNYNNFNLNGGETTSALKLQLEQQWNNIIRNHIMQVLVPVYGEDNLGVAVNCVVELGDSVIDDFQVHLPEEASWTASGGAGIIGSRVYGYIRGVGDGEPAGGTVGTTTNSDLYTDVEREPGLEEVPDRWQGEGSIEYENSKTQTHTIRTSGYISDCTVAVTINSTTAGQVNVAEVRDHVARAAGISAVETETVTAEEYLSGKISVRAWPFYDPTEPPAAPADPTILGIPMWAFFALGAGLLVFVIILIVILLLRRRKRAKQEAEERAVEELLAVAMPQEGEPVGADVMELHTEKSMELRQSIRDFVDENPEVAALLIKDWMKGDDGNG